MSKDKLKMLYEKRFSDYTIKLNALKKHLVLISLLRFITFTAAILLFVLLIKQFSYLKLASFLLFLFSFISLVIYNIRKTETLKHFQHLITINSNELKVLGYNYSVFNAGKEYINRNHAYAYDLDLFGEGGLFQYLNRTVTLVGREQLANQLLNINQLKENLINKRQEVIAELAPKIDWRQNFMATGYACPVNTEDNKKIDNWLGQPVYFIRRIIFKLIVVILPLAALTFLGLFIAGVSHYSWFILVCLIQLFIASLLLRRTNKEQNAVSEEMRILKNYAKLIKLIEVEEFKADILIKLQMNLQTENIKALVALKKLIRIIDAFDTRLNIFMGVILNATLMWDLYSLMRLEKWKLKYGKNIKNWVRVIAEFDSYISFSNYSYNNPGFINPDIDANVVLNAVEMGHPLIPEETRINNDFKVSEGGKIEIITGANMAGKSTFLRTVGVNLILAMVGAPVCARSFRFTLTNLFTGMRTADSLKENESYFYAELKRLKIIVEKLKQGKKTFILLDEILKGTNSVDKAKGSWKFVEHLLKLKATGIVATHDLTLCGLEKEYPGNIENKCFEVEINGDKINFDYKLRPGITQNMNASLLMKQMGIFTN